jgi:hypothetical protein
MPPSASNRVFYIQSPSSTLPLRLCGPVGFIWWYRVMVGPQVGKPAIPQILNRQQLTSSPSHLEDFRTQDPGLTLVAHQLRLLFAVL